MKNNFNISLYKFDNVSKKHLRNFSFFILHFSFFILLAACSKTDPVLPGQRENIFGGSALMYYPDTGAIPGLPDNAPVLPAGECECVVDSSNIIWIGEKKIFSGFPTSNYVQCEKQPVCDGDFVYAGLSTGELVKVNQKTRSIAWIADIYRDSNMTGGASMLDIVAPVVVLDNDVYAGGLGDAFCKLSKSSGSKRWCANVATAVAYVVTDPAIFVVGTDNNVYAINNKDGSIYWHAAIKKQSAPTLKDSIITVGKQKFKASTGESVK